jgi:hypothetical protein
LLCSEGRKSENQIFCSFQAKKLTFQEKEDQFWSIFSNRSDIRPRSDKADLLGSTELVKNNGDVKLGILIVLILPGVGEGICYQRGYTVLFIE